MGQYGKAAVEATKLYRDGLASSPEEAWEKAVRGVIESESSQRKACPHSAFLGLCEDGAVSGIRKGHYFKSRENNKNRKNKERALKALRLLEQDDSRFPNEKTLWLAVVEGEEEITSYQGQMDVVLSLWRARLIGGQR